MESASLLLFCMETFLFFFFVFLSEESLESLSSPFFDFLFFHLQNNPATSSLPSAPACRSALSSSKTAVAFVNFLSLSGASFHSNSESSYVCDAGVAAAHHLRSSKATRNRSSAVLARKRREENIKLSLPILPHRQNFQIKQSPRSKLAVFQ